MHSIQNVNEYFGMGRACLVKHPVRIIMHSRVVESQMENGLGFYEFIIFNLADCRVQ